MKLLTEETPGKVAGLLGASVFSLFLLFAVSTTNASFNGSESHFPSPFDPENVVAMLNSNPFSPENVVAFVDNATAGFASGVHVAITGPAGESFAFMNASFHDNWAWIQNETDVDRDIVRMAGLGDLLWEEPALQVRVAYGRQPAPVAVASEAPVETGKVAGAYVEQFKPVMSVQTVEPSLNEEGLLCDGVCQ